MNRAPFEGDSTWAIVGKLCVLCLVVMLLRGCAHLVGIPTAFWDQP